MYVFGQNTQFHPYLRTYFMDAPKEFAEKQLFI